MRWLRGCALALGALVPIALLALGFGRDPHAVPSMLVDKPAPDFELQALSGERFSLSQLRGRPVVLNFWASWCFPCLAEHETLQKAAAQLGSRVQFLGVIYEDTPEAIAALLKERGGAYPHLIDPHSRVALDYGVAGVPESFIVDATGKVVHKEAGVLSPDSLRRHLGPLVAASDGE